MRIEAAGFQSVTLNDVTVDPSIGRHVDVTMKPGESTSTVTVEAGANNVQTESAAVGQLVTQEQVKNIQLNGRNPLYLSQLEPGVVRNSSMASFAFGLDNNVNIGGARNQESVITLDGAPMVRTRSNGTSVGVADVDSTSQVQILTNSYPAEYGRSAGGQIRMFPRAVRTPTTVPPMSSSATRPSTRTPGSASSPPTPSLFNPNRKASATTSSAGTSTVRQHPAPLQRKSHQALLPRRAGVCQVQPRRHRLPAGSHCAHASGQL